MTHREKVQRLVDDLRKRGVNPSTTAPPFFRMLWALGIEIAPPLYLGFLPLLLLMGGFFGLMWGAVMWLIQWQFWHAPWEVALGAAAGAGLLFGLMMAAYYRWKAS